VIARAGARDLADQPGVTGLTAISVMRRAGARARNDRGRLGSGVHVCVYSTCVVRRYCFGGFRFVCEPCRVWIRVCELGGNVARVTPLSAGNFEQSDASYIWNN